MRVLGIGRGIGRPLCLRSAAAGTVILGAMVLAAPVTASAAPVPPPLTVKVTSPTTGSEFPSGSTVTVSGAASASVPATITSVAFYAENFCSDTGIRIGVAAAAPYTVQWQNVPVGDFAVTAVATTSRGTSEMSAPVEVTTTSGGFPPPCGFPPGHPSVALVSPQANTVLDSNRTDRVSAVTSVENDGSISSVTFFAVNTCGQATTTNLGTVTSAPYTVRWKPAAGDYTITAVAADGFFTVTSAPVQVFAGPHGIPPPCPAPSPSSAATPPR